MFVEKIKRTFLLATVFFRVWILWFLGKFLLLSARLFGWLEITGYKKEKLDRQNKGLLIICNHPDLWTPFLLPFIFASPKCLFSLKHVPISLADKKNYKRWQSLPFWFAFVFIERGNWKEALKVIEQHLKSILIRCGILIAYPEGGRTDKVIERRGAKYSLYGEKIALFPQGLAKLFEDTDFLVLPVWVKGGEKVIPNSFSFLETIHRPARFWKKTEIFIGEPLVAPKGEKNIIGWMEDLLLDTADSAWLHKQVKNV